MEGKSKQALKRARAKARKAAVAAAIGSSNGSPMLSRSQSGASSDSSQPYIARAAPAHEVRSLFICRRECQFIPPPSNLPYLTYQYVQLPCKFLSVGLNMRPKEHLLSLQERQFLLSLPPHPGTALSHTPTCKFVMQFSLRRPEYAA